LTLFIAERASAPLICISHAGDLLDGGAPSLASRLQACMGPADLFGHPLEAAPHIPTAGAQPAAPSDADDEARSWRV
jgi:hypothetical protein